MEEKFQVIRFLIALANLDGHFSQQEKEVVKKHLKMMKLNEDQRSVLTQDIYYPKDPTEIFEGIKNKAAQAQCLNIGRVLIFADGQDSLDEKQLIQILEKEHLQSISTTDTYKNLSETIHQFKVISHLKGENLKLQRENSFWSTIYWLRIF